MGEAELTMILWGTEREGEGRGKKKNCIKLKKIKKIKIAPGSGGGGEEAEVPPAARWARANFSVADAADRGRLYGSIAPRGAGPPEGGRPRDQHSGVGGGELRNPRKKLRA